MTSGDAVATEPAPGPDRLLRALVRIVAEHGLDAVSVRRVAAEAGTSVGLVQRRFPTKQAMLRAAMQAVVAGFRDQVRLARRNRAPADALREIAHRLVPLDAQRAEDGRVWLAFVARAATDRELAAEHRAVWRELEDLLCEVLAAARRHAGATDADRASAGLLLATLDGLAVAGLVEPDRLPGERIRALLDAQLDALLLADTP